jgi:hypothetical protein
MDVEKILAELRTELELIDKAIVRLQSLGRKDMRGRRRPEAAGLMFRHPRKGRLPNGK